MAFDPQKAEEIKNKLEAEKAKLTLELEAHQKPELYEDEQGSNVDPDVQADEAAGFADRLAMANAFRERINEIDSTINRINMGTYGRCAKCTKPIAEAALAAMPARTHCVDCQKAMNA